MSYIEPNELIFYNDNENGIHSGGFSVNSLLMKAGMSPIMTLNQNKSGGAGEQVSDLFNDLVVPNWSFFMPSGMTTGGKKDNYIDDSDDDDVIDEELHDKLLALATNEKATNEKATNEKATNENKHKKTKKVFKINKNKKSRKNKSIKI
jgi:hypothetical protein